MFRSLTTWFKPAAAISHCSLQLHYSRPYSSNEPRRINNGSPRARKRTTSLKVGVSALLRSALPCSITSVKGCPPFDCVFCSAPFNSIPLLFSIFTSALSHFILSWDPDNKRRGEQLHKNSESCFKLQLCARMESVNWPKWTWTYSSITNCTRGSCCQGLAWCVMANFHSRFPSIKIEYNILEN